MDWLDFGWIGWIDWTPLPLHWTTTATATATANYHYHYHSSSSQPASPCILSQHPVTLHPSQASSFVTQQTPILSSLVSLLLSSLTALPVFGRVSVHFVSLVLLVCRASSVPCSTSMSTSTDGAAVKLPLALRRDARDSDVQNKKLLEDAAKWAGSAITFEFDLDAAYKLMLAVRKEEAMEVAKWSPMALKKALPFLQKVDAEPILKADLARLWSKKLIRLRFVESDEEVKRVLAQPLSVMVHGNNCAYHLQDGELLILVVAKEARQALDYGSAHDKARLVYDPSTAGDEGVQPLPPQVRMELPQYQQKVKQIVTAIKLLEGLDDFNFDMDEFVIHHFPANHQVVLDSWKRRLQQATLRNDQNQVRDLERSKPLPFGTDQQEITRYFQTGIVYKMEWVKDRLMAAWKDSLVREELLEAWTRPHNLEIVPEVDFKDAAAMVGSVVAQHESQQNFGFRLRDGKMQLICKAEAFKAQDNGTVDMARLIE